MRNVIALVLGGGQGTRLYPLTKVRSKPAVPVAGKYRLIDIPISNCINSGLNRIYVLTQFNSASLHQHIRSTYIFDAFDRGFVEILAAQQTLENANWYQGTADAVRQNLRNIEEPGIEYVLILSGDQLYRMDFREMLQTHVQTNADVTISAIPIESSQASSMGIMRVDATGRVVGFLEKPKTVRELDLVRTDPAWIEAQRVKSKGRTCLASMGIYLFNRKTLIDALEKTSYRDFGKEVFPASMRTHRVQCHLFDGYWEDIGTIKSFFEANLQLADPHPAFDLSVPVRSDLHPGAVPAAVADRAGNDSRQPRGRRLPHRGGRRGGKQRHRPALHHRSRGHDPQFDPHGQRLLRAAGRNRGRHGSGHHLPGRGRRIARRRRDRRQELPHRRQCPPDQQPRHRERRRNALRHDSRRHLCRRQGNHAARWLGAVEERWAVGWAELASPTMKNWWDSFDHEYMVPAAHPTAPFPHFSSVFFTSPLPGAWC